jgi:hypothetical protein
MQTPIYLNTLEAKGITLTSVLAELESVFPPTTFTPEDSMEKIMYRSGQRSVVEWILQKIEEED